MNVLIIEDEKAAADKLARLLYEYNQDIKVLDILSSINQAVQWLKNNQPKTDIIFMDIKLSDGLSFEIFNYINIIKPVIFITAFSEFALDAFDTNGIDYILKPLTYNKLSAGLKKLEHLRQTLNPANNKMQIDELSKTLSRLQKNYKTRFMVKIGQHIRSFTTEEISLFYAEGRNVFLFTNKANAYIVDYRMEDLEYILNPEIFFRANRSYLVNIKDIKDVLIYSKSRLRIIMNSNFEEEIVVSRDKVSLFKNWFDGME